MYWHKGIQEKEASNNTHAQWLVDLREDHSHLQEQNPVNITMAHVQKRVSGMKSWTAPGTDMIHSYWLKKTPCTPCGSDKAAAERWDPPTVIDSRPDSLDHEGHHESPCRAKMSRHVAQYMST